MKRFSRRRILILAACICGADVPAAIAQQPRAGSTQRVALDGYDPVSYFEAGHPEKGLPQFSFAFDDAAYWFKSAEHMAKFAADPERYAPQYAGYCALTLAAGSTVGADPEAWSISNGKLYVFGAKEGVQKFNANPLAVIDAANSNWKKMQETK